ncbi:hypothetical protein BD410DRAFT_775400 [Rickenella mellea]|uniref:Uncharacterized protein n=1 Tax=Rickenella mellea TaxID=50990 RepID=A0A4Y7PSI6_9AGAM|nr:hypothetical protein BD410DRAFT_775400 [Rickenella mellea]
MLGAMFNLFSRSPYALLPSDNNSRQSARKYLTKRTIIFWTSAPAAFILFYFAVFRPLGLWKKSATPLAVAEVDDWRDYPEPPLPPDYEHIYEFERKLPQHNQSLPFPEGSTGRYFYSANHADTSGWNNILQEYIFLAHLAYASQRSFVFDPYEWDPKAKGKWSKFGDKVVPARIPLNALVSGPMAGGPVKNDRTMPRAVNKAYFDKVCPHPTVIPGDVVPEGVGSTDGNFIMVKWVKKLLTMTDRCIRLDGSNSQIFPYYVFGMASLIESWPWMSESPILREFRWSPLVESAVLKNLHRIVPSTTDEGYPDGQIQFPYKPIHGLLAVHIRRGDYIDHCWYLAHYAATFQGWNTFPEYVDKFQVPAGVANGTVTPEAMEVYMEHCLPNHAQVLAKIASVRQTPEAKGLKHIFIMTNAKADWANELKDKLMAQGGWDTVTTSRDMHLSWEQKFISQAVDMLIGQRAQVFIGNGWSSLTSNTVLLRRSMDFLPRATRFW